MSRRRRWKPSLAKSVALLLLSAGMIAGSSRVAESASPSSVLADKVLPVVGLVPGQVLRLDFLETDAGLISGACQVAVVCNNAATGAVAASTGTTPLMLTPDTASSFDVSFAQVAPVGFAGRVELYCTTSVAPGTCGAIVQSAVVYNQSTGETNYVPLALTAAAERIRVLLPCGISPLGVCAGACPKGTACATDSAGLTCGCKQIPLCGAKADGTCGGACPKAGMQCQALVMGGNLQCACGP